MKVLRFADTQESCYEAWKRSHMGCSALLSGRFADSKKSRFQASKRSNMISAVLDGGRSAYIHIFCFQAGKRSDMDCAELQRCLFVHCLAWHIQVSKISNNCSDFLQGSRFPVVHK